MYIHHRQARRQLCVGPRFRHQVVEYRTGLVGLGPTWIPPKMKVHVYPTFDLARSHIYIERLGHRLCISLCIELVLLDEDGSHRGPRNSNARNSNARNSNARNRPATCVSLLPCHTKRQGTATSRDICSSSIKPRISRLRRKTSSQVIDPIPAKDCISSHTRSAQYIRHELCLKTTHHSPTPVFPSDLCPRATVVAVPAIWIYSLVTKYRGRSSGALVVELLEA
jgi:hypothetical protein